MRRLLGVRGVCVVTGTDVKARWQRILIDHQRTESGCLCGFTLWGASHAEHVVDQLADAGLRRQPLRGQLPGGGWVEGSLVGVTPEWTILHVGNDDYRAVRSLSVHPVELSPYTPDDSENESDLALLETLVGPRNDLPFDEWAEQTMRRILTRLDRLREAITAQPTRQESSQGTEKCTDMRCTRIDGRCVGMHCTRCGGPCGPQGHIGGCPPGQLPDDDPLEDDDGDGVLVAVFCPTCSTLVLPWQIEDCPRHGTIASTEGGPP